MTAASAAIWLIVMFLALRAVYSPERPAPQSGPRGHGLIIYGGVVIPSVLLAALLSYGLALLPRMLARAPEGSLRVSVVGHQWWWRVRYSPDASEAVELANEIRLPAGEPVEFLLESHDVIHSFWIPSLGGKVDMIPGRQTRLTLMPTKTGELRGVCAEFCGDSHAFMAFPVVIQAKEEFARWLAEQRSPAREPATGLERAGYDVFIANGCGACHTVRGTPADGVVGPDLTHVGGRSSLAAGLLSNRQEDFNRWVALTDRIKPGAHMPAFDMLHEEELRALAAFLESLK